MVAYTEKQVADGARLRSVVRHCFGLVHGRRGARRFRRFLTEKLMQPDAGPLILRQALDYALNTAPWAPESMCFESSPTS